MADFEVVIDKLHGFETAEDIAEYFRHYGIKGTVANATACAITRFIEEETGEVGQYSTSPSFVTKIGNNNIMNMASIRNTTAMVEFIHKFDLGKFPELVDNYNGCEPLLCA